MKSAYQRANEMAAQQLKTLYDLVEKHMAGEFLRRQKEEKRCRRT